MANINLPVEWNQPPVEFSLAPFWFWNDDLDETELSRQMDEFQAHGVDAFVLHPRLGLPEHYAWMSQALLDKMRFGIEQAQARGMQVILYDEGMYPSGSSAGQVVAENPEFQCRGMVRINLDTVQASTIEQGVQIDANRQVVLADNQTLVAEVIYNNQRYAIVDRPINSVIRGLHYLDESIIDAMGESPEVSHLATDLLNPDAVACFIRLVYDRFYTEFSDYFGTTITKIFTDEPMLLGRPNEKGVMPSTRGILDYVNDFLGYDFSPHLPALWDDDVPEDIFAEFERAIEHRLEASYYTQLYDWCEQHSIALTGHPAEPDATRHLRYFHIPGQDIVWRYIEPDTASALEGRQSTQGKAASSMMLHTHRRRNANEFSGAYGHNLTFAEMRWLANWLLIRGCNLLIPHAFYYSMRGPRKDERPPDVGLHSAWWDDGFKEFALTSRRLSWLNTDSQHICHVAIIGEHHRLPWRAAKACFQHQIDFNYLDIDDFERCTIDNGKLSIADQHYTILVVDSELPSSAQAQLEQFAEQIPVIHWSDNTTSHIQTLKTHLPPSPFANLHVSGLRVRHLQKANLDWHILFNEEKTPITINIYLDNAYLLDLASNTTSKFTGEITLESYAVKLIIQEKSS